jgi:acetylornithine deacetylase
MAVQQSLRDKVNAYIDEKSDEIIALAQELIRISSINHPPTGEEATAQEYVVAYLSKAGLEPDSYLPTDVNNIQQHPAWWPGRDFTNRPNVAARLEGKGTGRSLLLSGHIDTVPLGTTHWSVDPFGAEIKDGKLYGLGSMDMKGGCASLLSAIRFIKELDIPLAGDLIAETVADEEFGGANGTLAGRLRGYTADAMITTEPSQFSIWLGNRGGRVAQLHFRAPAGGIAIGSTIGYSAVDQINTMIAEFESFKALRRLQVPDWKDLPHDPVPAWVTKISCGGWGTNVPVTVPSEGDIELYWQLQLGETQEQVDNQFNSWLSATVEKYPSLYPTPPEVVIPYRWMPASQVSADHPMIRILRHLHKSETGEEPIVEIGHAPSDAHIVNVHFPPCPSIMYGPSGAHAHEADEYVIVTDLIKLTKLLVLFAIEWCGLAD